MSEFVNPYNFVRSEYDRNKTAAPLAHDRWRVGQFSGRIECSLETIKRVTSKSFEESIEGRIDERIYGSTLKGMIRSVAEAVSLSCFPLGGSKCQSADRLCICCRTFGWLQSGSGGGVHLGRVSISDAKPSSIDWREQTAVYIQDQTLSSPKPNRHANFYRSGGADRGRKFYYHHHPNHQEQKLTTRRPNPEAKPILIARANATFSIQVDFTDLSSAELGLLLFALQLEDGLYHKVGKAKPLGLGTVKIKINAISLLPRNRYESWDACLTAVELLSSGELDLPPIQSPEAGVNAEADAEWTQLTPEERRGCFVDARIESFFQAQFGKSYAQRYDNDMPHMQDLKRMLSLNDYPIHYPSKKWFDDNPATELPTAEEVEGNPPGDRSEWLEE